jgi:hypothetical protein
MLTEAVDISKLDRLRQAAHWKRAAAWHDCAAFVDTSTKLDTKDGLDNVVDQRTTSKHTRS